MHLRICRPWALFVLLVGCADYSVSPQAEEPVSTVSTSGDRTDLTDLWRRQGGTDWPCFLGPQRDGTSSETGIAEPWPEKGPPVVWQRVIGSGYAIGSTSKGRYYHFEGDARGRRGNGAGRLVCLSAETGNELWDFEYKSDYVDMLGYDAGARCSPIVDGNRVYLYGVEGMLFCLRASDGELIWKVNTSEEFGVVQNFFGVGSTPIVEGDLLICMVGGSPPGSPGLYESGGKVDGNGSGIVAFDKLTGDVRYRITDELASYASPQVATIGDRRWCFVFARGGLVGFDPATGQFDFRYPWRSRLLESVNASTPVVVGDEVFISETYSIGSSLLSVRPGGYEIVWRDEPRRREKAMRTHWNTPIHIDGYLYGCSGRNSPDADLRCVEWNSGKVMWVERPEVPQRSSLLFVDGHFVCLGEYGTLQLIRVDPKRCDIVSEVLLEDEAGRPLLRHPCWAAPILSHGLLYVRGEGRLVCLDLRS